MDYFTEPQQSIPHLDDYEIEPSLRSGPVLGPYDDDEDDDCPEDDEIDPGCW